MSTRFFGQFLVEAGAVTHTQLREATELMGKRNLRLGQLAVSKGILSEKQVRAAARMQRGLDAKWGEIAVVLGYWDDETFNQLLEEQQKSHLSIGEALVQKGSLTSEQRDKYLDLFFTRHDPSHPAANQAPSETAKLNLPDYVSQYLPHILYRLSNLQVKLGPPGIRPLELDFYFTSTLTIELSGDSYLDIGLGTDRNFTQALVSGMIEPAPDHLNDELLYDGLGEFLNIFAGGVRNRYTTKGQPEHSRIPRRRQLPPTGLAFEIHSLVGNAFLIVARGQPNSPIDHAGTDLANKLR